MMFTRLRTGVVLGLVLTVVGCSPTPAPQKHPSEDNPAGHVKRGKEKLANEIDLNQLALAYNSFITTVGKPPQNAGELEADNRDLRAIMAKVRKGTFVVRWGIKPQSGVILAYEKDADLNGNHLAVSSGEGAVTTLSSKDLQEALKRGG